MTLKNPSVWLWLALAGCGANDLTVEDGAIANAGGDDEVSSNVGQAITARKCPAGATVPGIDVSIYQHSVNWSAVKASGIAFGIARVSDGTGSLDSTFAPNWAGMKAAVATDR